MAIFVQDSFTDVDATLLQNHTPDIGGVWEKSGTGDGTITGNQLTSAFFNVIYRNVAVPTYSDYDVSVLVVAATVNVSLLARVQDFNNRYSFRYNVSTTTYDLLRVLAGNSVVLASFVEAATFPAVMRFEVRFAGPARLRGFMDGVEKVSSNDETFTQPYSAGLGLQGASGGTILDNFLASDSPQVAVQTSLNIIRTPDKVNVY